MLLYAFSWWGILLRIVAFVHFIKRRPDYFWIWVIMIHPIGALAYIVVEVIPDAGLLRSSFQVFPRRRRIQQLEHIVLDNPSAGNYEELGLLYLDDGKFAQARAAYDKAISSRTDHADPFYRRAIAEIELGDYTAAVPDLERTVTMDADYDFHRAKGLLAWAYAQTDQHEKADAMFREALKLSTISETYYHYALFLQSQGRAAEAREFAQKIISKKATMPSYLRRRERPWFRRASGLLSKLPA
ncbi:MAG TPA: tetratricopeptide repeat protein [Candidatus Solibacter sp.]|nr:tetratricopeptide repeat protein [Candidatus Solibacter sp.]